MKKPHGTYWAIQVRANNWLDGKRSHLHHECCVPVLFRTREEAREHRDIRYGYIRDRPDLKKQPHGWLIPRAVKVRVEVVDE